MRPALPDSPDRVLFSNGEVRVGAFRCPRDHPEFSTAGRIEGYTVTFPRTSVWIQHPDRRPFVADPTVVTIYNQGQQYVRKSLAPDGDRTDWFSVCRGLAEAIVAGVRPDAAHNPAGLFPVTHTRVPAGLYRRQRLLFRRIQRGLADAFEVEHEVTVLIGAVLRTVIDPGADPGRLSTRTQMVERTRAELARDPFRNHSVRGLAGRVEASPYHLCRTFRRQTGLTLHHYLLELRTRVALERFEQGETLSRIALDLGFSSHSHFSAEFRRRMGTMPSRVRGEVLRLADRAIA